MQSDGPYELGDKIFIRGRSNSWELQTKADVELANHAYAEGRKAAEPGTDPSGVSLQNFMGGAK